MNNSSMIKVITENTVSLNLVSLYTTTLALQKVMNGLFRMTLKIENRIEHLHRKPTAVVAMENKHQSYSVHESIFSLITQIQHYFPLSINLILTRYIYIITFYLASLSFSHRSFVLGCRCWPFNR